jgi:GT2 family glycosyltransferase
MSETSWPKAAVVVCTRNRPADVALALQFIGQDRADSTVIVVDASAEMTTAEACELASRRFPSLDLHYVKADRPGLARQRNQSAGYCRDLGIDIVHFIDDDTRILPGYQDAIEDRFRTDPGLSGVGAVIENQPAVGFKGLKRTFGLWGPRPSSVLRSGRAVLGQYPTGPEPERVEWLSGCSMSYRIEAITQHRFDDRLTGYSKGEDKDFGFRVSRSGRLAVEPKARCLHEQSPHDRMAARRAAFDGTLIVFSWAREQRRNGISVIAFCWSAIGDAILRFGLGVVRRDPESIESAIGTLQALGRIASGRLEGTNS